ncbi:MAG: translation initiation factor IF-2 [Kiritimatiellia bacterium]
MRIFELAKELNVSSKDLLAKLRAMGIEAPNHMSALTDAQIAQIRGAPAKEKKAPPAPAKPVAPPPPAPEPEPEPEPVKEEPAENIYIVKGPIVVKEFSEALNLKPNQLIAELMMMNIFAAINATIDFKIAQKIGEKHGLKVELEKAAAAPAAPTPPAPGKKKKEEEEKKPEEGAELEESRPPVVTFLGHVDHGKTSLLDYIRKSTVAKGEDGGITQHIGAYTVEHADRQITFLDTPGHAAFTAMRARGANLTDIAVLVIAADDGVMPQTREAIQHAQAAGVTIIAAINKVDLPGANVDRVKQQLQEMGLSPEDWGGDVICCPVSAITGAGMDNLLEMINLQADMLELKANPRQPATGYVIEARLEPGMGPTATFLVCDGMLKVGDAVVCGATWGRVKALLNDKGHKVRTAGPASPVKVMGLTSVPDAGSEFSSCANDREAREIAESRQAQDRMDSLTAPQRASLDNIFTQMAAESSQQTLNLVLKADVKGSVEAIEQMLQGIKSDKVSLNLVLTGVGNITENDILLATASNAIVVGFHVSAEGGAKAAAKRSGVEIRLYSIIYELFDQIKEAMTGMLEPEFKQRVIGHAEIRQVFALSKRGNVAGCMVTDGRVTSRAKVRVLRKNDVLFEGSLVSLKRYQNDAAEVREGQDCGIRLDNFSDYQEGDTLEFYEIDKIAQAL